MQPDHEYALPNSIKDAPLHVQSAGRQEERITRFEKVDIAKKQAGFNYINTTQYYYS